MGALDNPNFWKVEAKSIGMLRNDGSLNYVLLDRTFQMLPLIRNTKTTFTDFLSSNKDAKGCIVIVNGNFYGLTSMSVAVAARIGIADSPSDTLIQGQIVKDGKVVAGDSRPLSFWFGQTALPITDPWGWGYAADQGDPPTSGGIMNAIGGAGPLIAGALTYGVGNQYKPGAPANVPEPPIGQPPPAALPYLIQRNNSTFKDANSRPPQTGKTILAYCSNKRMILVAVQPDGMLPGQTHSGLAFALAQRGFDAAVFLDGSDSATMIFERRVVVAPGDRKNATIDVGVGFFN